MKQINNGYKETLVKNMKEYAHLVYKVTQGFPPEEKFGLTSQWRRAAISIALNYIEGYSRFKIKSQIQFFEISFGSLKESKFLEEFCKDEDLIEKENYQKLNELSEEISKMLWTDIKRSKDHLQSI